MRAVSSQSLQIKANAGGQTKQAKPTGRTLGAYPNISSDEDGVLFVLLNVSSESIVKIGLGPDPIAACNTCLSCSVTKMHAPWRALLLRGFELGFRASGLRVWELGSRHYAEGTGELPQNFQRAEQISNRPSVGLRL